jgi:quercetin dioxygenase-like cupin family protein
MSIVIRPSEIPARPDPSAFRVLLRGEQTGGVLSAIEQTLRPKAFITPHTHANDVWVQVLSGSVGALVGDEMDIADAGDWILKPRDVVHAMWNASQLPATIVELLTPAGTEVWFEEISDIADDDTEGFQRSCRQFGIQFLPDSPWTNKIRERFDL